MEEARAALAASKKLYYRIGEVSALTGVKAHVLRYWETEFRWMAPPKSRSKQRLYRKRDIELVWLLKRLLWEQRYTIAGARQRIAELGLDEALARATDSAESALAGALALDGLDGSLDRIHADPLDSAPGRPSNFEAANGVGAPEGARSGGLDWVALREVIESMQAELFALRGSLLREA